MLSSTMSKPQISCAIESLISRLVPLIPWPLRRKAMGDITLTLLEGNARTSETIFGWSRSGVTIGINECRSSIVCVNDISSRRKPRTEETQAGLLSDIKSIMEPESQAEPRLRTTIGYTNMTAQAVRDALLEKGWSEDVLPKVRTISNILNRQEYRLRTVAKTKVQKKRSIPTPSSKMSG